MHVNTKYIGGAIAQLLDPDGPRIDEINLSKAEVAALNKAADILERMRSVWGGDDNDPWDTDVALAMHTCREIAEGGGIELGSERI